ncbi:MAG: peptidase domain-containing ABC transporter [Nitritalea sp.]
MKIDVAQTPLNRFFSFLREEKKQVYAIYFYAVLNGLVGLSLPLGIQAILNFILGGRISTSWYILVAVVAIGIAFGGFLQISQLYLTEKLQQRVFTKAGFNFAYRLPRLKLDALLGKYPPELVNRFFDAVNLQKGLSKILIDFSTASIQVVFGLLLLAFYHPFFIIFAATLIALVFLIFYFTSPRGMYTALKESTAKYQVAYWLEEIGRTMSTFKLAGNSQLPFLRADKLLTQYVNFRNQHFSVLIFQYKILVGFKVLIVSTLLIAGSILLINDEISIGQFVAAEIVIVLVVSAVEKLILSLETIYDTLTAVEKLGQIMDLPMERADGTEKSLTPERSGLAFDIENLGFKSKTENFDVLKGISFSIQAGEKLLLTGRSGSGKSTLLYLMSGLYQDYSGKILVNNLPIDSMNLDKLRSFVGDSLTQQSLFHGSLRENIVLCRDISEDKLRATLDLVGLNKFIYSLKDDLETMVQPEGVGLSKRVISKILMARCLVGEPKALFLEDILMNFEKEARERTTQHILEGSWTVIMITDQEEILRQAPRVIALDTGKIVYDGAGEGYSR